jgi:hypothetical protein
MKVGPSANLYFDDFDFLSVEHTCLALNGHLVLPERILQGPLDWPFSNKPWCRWLADSRTHNTSERL